MSVAASVQVYVKFFEAERNTVRSKKKLVPGKQQILSCLLTHNSG
jgi:hypothetical protein